jgi:hypothetical protein
METVDGSTNVPGGLVCECCPSDPFYHAGFHNLVRVNVNNTRDIWLLSSENGEAPYDALDVDPLDWFISSCPATGSSHAVFSANGTHLAAFKAPDSDGDSRVYISEFSTPVADLPGQYLATAPLTWNMEGGTQNFPTLATCDGFGSIGQLTACVWEQNSGGYDVQLMLSSAQDISAFTDQAVNLTSEWGGHHRKPQIALVPQEDHAILHLIWKSTVSGTIKYLRGIVQLTTGVPDRTAEATPSFVAAAHGSLQLSLPAGWEKSEVRVWNSLGQLIFSAPSSGPTFLLPNLPDSPVIVSVTPVSGGAGWAKKCSTAH